MRARARRSRGQQVHDPASGPGSAELTGSIRPQDGIGADRGGRGDARWLKSQGLYAGHVLERGKLRFRGDVGVHAALLQATGRARPEAALPIDTVKLSVQAAQCLHSQLFLPGAFRSGPLFGHRDDGTLHVAYAAPAGYLRWADHDPARPFTLDPGYVLGWTDALRTVHGESIDWVGGWLSFPDTLTADRATEQPLIRQARTDGLIGDDTVLLCIGWNRHEVEVHAYAAFADDMERLLAVEWLSAAAWHEQ